MINFNKIYVVACIAVTAAGAALLSSCEWSGGGGATTYNSRYNFVNFSGVYRGTGGGLLVTDYTKSGGNSTNVISSETIATANGVKTTFSGILSKRPLSPGSITIFAPPSYTFTDTDADGNLTAATPSGSSAYGVINYQTGAWSLDFQGVSLDGGSKIKATYQIVNSIFSGGGGSTISGSTGGAISSFNIEHYGNVMNITDNNGRLYTGQFGDIRSTGGLSQDATTGTVSVGESFIGSFTAEGVSSANVKVKMAGNLNGTVTAVSGSGFVLGQRTISGTWIEEGGKVGDIQGSASDVTLAVP